EGEPFPAATENSNVLGYRETRRCPTLAPMLIGRKPATAPPAAGRHPFAPSQLERFIRGELPRDEVREVVRHLMTGCAACLLVTGPVWELGDQPLVNVEDGVWRPWPPLKKRFNRSRTTWRCSSAGCGTSWAPCRRAPPGPSVLRIWKRRTPRPRCVP